MSSGFDMTSLIRTSCHPHSDDDGGEAPDTEPSHTPRVIGMRSSLTRSVPNVAWADWVEHREQPW